MLAPVICPFEFTRLDPVITRHMTAVTVAYTNGTKQRLFCYGFDKCPPSAIW
jgi:hypothetical protein